MNDINKLKFELNANIKAVNALLSNNPDLKYTFNAIIKDGKSSNEFLGAGGTSGSSWYDSGFFKNLTNFATSSYTQNQLNKDQQAKLKIHLDTIKAQNVALDKQISLAKEFNNVKSYGKSFIGELSNSPMKIAAIGGLIWYFLKGRKK